jgi:hypothetical protein
MKQLFRTSVLTWVVAASALGLSGCGGGADLYLVGSPFDISISISGQPLNGGHVGPGATQRVWLPVGQSIALDANEPVEWSLNVGGSTVTGQGATVYYGGVAITQTTLTRSRILIDTSSNYALGAPLSFTLVATSTYDRAQVATVQVILTN